MISNLIDHYLIISLIGKGGMGEVYLAQDTRHGRQVALKANAVAANEIIVIGFSMSGRFAQYLPVVARHRVRG